MKKLDATDPETHSRDVIAENIERLKAMFPELITEGPGGAAVNVDVLKDLVGDRAVTDCDEKFGLNWHGKRRARRLALTPSTGTLRPCPEESVDWETTQNLMIEGDNLEVLKLLQKSYAGKVKLIYIDPPYNTGKDFVYPDNFQDSIKNYLELTGQVEGGAEVSSNTEASGRFHTDWLKMVYPRVKLAWSLLAQNGLLFVSIDDRELANLRLLMDDLFGAENFLGTIVWRTATDNNPTQIATDHEYIVAYARNANELGTWERTSSKAPAIAAKYDELRQELGEDTEAIQGALRDWIRSVVRSGDVELDGVSHYSYVDERGVYYPGNSANTRPGGYDFDIVHPTTGEVCAKPANGYRWPQETFQAAAAAGEVHWGLDHTTVPKIKKRIETATELLKSSYYEDNRGSTKELADMMGDKVFDNPKSPRLLRRLLEFVTEDEDIVLDFFAGSGTTADAVMRLNAHDGSCRRYLLVQLPEPLDPTGKDQRAAAVFCKRIGTPPNIAELTKERLRRAAQKIRDENPLFAGDLGFRVFKLDSSNIRAWDPDPDDLDQTLLDSVEHLKDDRTETDVLYELLLKLGLDLCVPIETRTMAGKEVHAVGGGVLFACLSERITSNEIEGLSQGIVEWHEELAPAGDTTCVFRDSAFADDVGKTNMAAILEQHGIENVRSL